MNKGTVLVTSLLRSPEGVYFKPDDLEPGLIQLEDETYIDGVLILTINGVPIITEGDWDLIDQLWSYIVDGLAALERTDIWSTSFPDQPVHLSIRRSGAQAEVSLHYDDVLRKASCDFQVLRTALLTEAARIFTHIDRLFPSQAAGNLVYHQRIARMLNQP